MCSMSLISRRLNGTHFWEGELLKYRRRVPFINVPQIGTHFCLQEMIRDTVQVVSSASRTCTDCGMKTFCLCYQNSLFVLHELSVWQWKPFTNLSYNYENALFHCRSDRALCLLQHFVCSFVIPLWFSYVCNLNSRIRTRYILRRLMMNFCIKQTRNIFMRQWSDCSRKWLYIYGLVWRLINQSTASVSNMRWGYLSNHLGIIQN